MNNDELFYLEKLLAKVNAKLVQNEQLQAQVQYYINYEANKWKRIEDLPKHIKDLQDYREIIIKQIEDAKHNKLQRQAGIGTQSDK